MAGEKCVLDGGRAWPAWFDEIWVEQLEEGEGSGVFMISAEATLEEEREFERYVHGNVHDDLKRYHAHMIEQERGKAAALEARIAALEDELRKAKGLAVSMDDVIYQRAVGIIVLSGRASTSHLAGRLGLGYSDACQLMERAEAEGVVSRPNEFGARHVLAQRGHANG